MRPAGKAVEGVGSGLLGLYVKGRLLGWLLTAFL